MVDDLDTLKKKVEALEQEAKFKDERRELIKRARIAKASIDKDKPLNLLISALKKRAEKQWGEINK